MATEDVPWFRALYDEILAYKRHTLFHDVLMPWTERARVAVRAMARFRTPVVYDPKDEEAQASMWNLYALGRVNDLLLMSFQSVNGDLKLATISDYEYRSFFTSIGFTLTDVRSFDPLHHEVVRVEQSSDDNEPVQIYEQLWPELMLGQMIFSRAGVSVLAGRSHIIKEVAEQSTLYFSFRRANRKTSDLSKGWGSNSQWRTDFRRDYQAGNTRIYNVDGINQLKANGSSSTDKDGLTAGERIEHCKFRCFVVTPKPDQDLWPLDDRYEEENDRP